MTDDPKVITKSVTKIIINGQEIDDPEKVPEGLRKFVEDTNKNNIPDFMEQFLKDHFLKNEIQNMKDLTPEQQAKITKVLEKLGSSTTQSPSESAPSVAIRSSPRVPQPQHQIDYKSMGIEDPEQKSSPRSLLTAALIGGLIILGILILLKGRILNLH